MTTLTPDEEKEFTYVNLLAFTIARQEATATNTKIPCWLCTSEEARERHRQKAIKTINDATRPLIPFTASDLPTFNKFIKNTLTPDMLEHWKNIELKMKTLRIEEHNPQAFFI